jgi:hypothetical protein
MVFENIETFIGGLSLALICDPEFSNPELPSSPL